MDLLADRLDSISFLIRPPADGGQGLLHPVLCFLHGDDEASPAPIHAALTRHGPLREDASPRTAEFLVLAPQMPHGGDHWNRHSSTVREILLDVRARFNGDPRRTYVTGFSFGGNGALDFSRLQPDLWAAVWAVDPTRSPRRRLAHPVWISVGESARAELDRFIAVLDVANVDAGASGDALYDDQGVGHVVTAARAYRNDRIYAWLLGHQAPMPETLGFPASDPRPARRSAWYDAAVRAGEAPRRARRG